MLYDFFIDDGSHCRQCLGAFTQQISCWFVSTIVLQLYTCERTLELQYTYAKEMRGKQEDQYFSDHTIGIQLMGVTLACESPNPCLCALAVPEPPPPLPPIPPLPVIPSFTLQDPLAPLPEEFAPSQEIPLVFIGSFEDADLEGPSNDVTEARSLFNNAMDVGKTEASADTVRKPSHFNFSLAVCTRILNVLLVLTSGCPCCGSRSR